MARLALDLQLRYRPTTEIDLARADLWAAQILVDKAAGDEPAVAADVFALDYVRDRWGHAFGAAAEASLNTSIVALQVALIDGDLDAAAAAARQLRQVIAGLLPVA